MPNILSSLILPHEQAQELIVILEAYKSLYHSDSQLKELKAKDFELSWKNGKLTVLYLSTKKNSIKERIENSVLNHDLRRVFLG